MTAPSIEAVKALQKRLNLLEVHIVWLGPSGFVIAHTDEERAQDFDLEDCDLHGWLSESGEPPAVAGYYVVVPSGFPDSPFDFFPLGEE